MRILSLLTLLFCYFISLNCHAQTGSINEPVRYIGGVTIDPNVHEGRLRYAIGIESRQTIRVNRTHPELPMIMAGPTTMHPTWLIGMENQSSVKTLKVPKQSQVKTINFTSKKGYATGFATRFWCG